MHQGWEEITDAAITHLLRTCLAKSAKDQAGQYFQFSMYLLLRSSIRIASQRRGITMDALHFVLQNFGSFY